MTGIPREALSPTPIRLLTWNLRYDSRPDSIPLSSTLSSLPRTVPADSSTSFYHTPSEAPWSTRRITVAREILFSRPDFVCVQEALIRQVHDLQELLPEYKWIGVGRDDGEEAGEFEAIFYLPRMGLESWETVWLGPSPFSPGSKFPGAGSVRTVTVGRFAGLTVLATHWDEQSDAQRRLAGSLVRWLGCWESGKGRMVVLAGDFNSPPEGEDAGAYEIVMGRRGMVDVPTEFERRFPVGKEVGGWWFKDLAQETEPLGRSGHLASFTGFRGWRKMDLTRIDFVCAGGGGWRAVRYRVGENWWDAERMGSDHRPVWVDFEVVRSEERGRTIDET